MIFIIINVKVNIFLFYKYQIFILQIMFNFITAVCEFSN